MWKDLSLKDKSELMKAAVKDGLTDLNAIKKFANGGIANMDNNSVLYDPSNQLSTHKFDVSKPIDYEELKRRQAWTESKGRDFAISHKGAKGRYQIMPSVHKAYIDKTGDVGSLFDTTYNEKVRDWQMEQNRKSKYINNPALSDSMRVAREFYAYNAGIGNLGKVLNKAKEAGVDINNDWSWMDYGYTEPKNYVNFTVRNIDSGGNRTNEKYNKYKNRLK